MANYIPKETFIETLQKVSENSEELQNKIMYVCKREGIEKNGNIDLDSIKYTGDEELLKEFEPNDIIILRKTVSILDGDETTLLSNDERKLIYIMFHINNTIYTCAMSKATCDRFKVWLYDDNSLCGYCLATTPSFTCVFDNGETLVIFKEKIEMVEFFLSKEDMIKRYPMLKPINFCKPV